VVRSGVSQAYKIGQHLVEIIYEKQKKNINIVVFYFSFNKSF
jgi:aromatic ring-opening dioxygenase LigB subunit